MIAPRTVSRQTASTIIVADDDPDDQLLLGLALTEMLPGFFIRYAENGQEAFDYLQTCKTQPLLIITDMHMPLLDGAALIQHLRKQHLMERVPMVVLSSMTNEADQMRCRQAGANAYWAKPQSYGDEVRLVRHLIQAWLPLLMWTTGYEWIKD